jgi:hypothetical protein
MWVKVGYFDVGGLLGRVAHLANAHGRQAHLPQSFELLEHTTTTDSNTIIDHSLRLTLLTPCKRLDLCWPQ